ncbi:MAG TPA: FlgD immunoglobulin-like domain containing protein [Candidatus Krumholzibacteria bacterium]|nr:FlgD immunoglobulin-like domain containing protein [Candidatus Krumholzibacteria bacterium]HPD70147.1 FlgD immunoglobulin-like domain containing protein [Candidatus Krumholzibacteria bacterium]HRY40153.1 FlgD immunoglobulin-like domain containing protein [Candidatus Krumholzibacteria bacterium]
MSLRRLIDPVFRLAPIACLAFAGAVSTAGASDLGHRPIQATVAWSPSAAVDEDGQPLAPATRYEVYATRDGGQEFRLAEVAGDTCCVAKFHVGVTYRVRVVGFDASGRASESSEWSDPVSFGPFGLNGLASGKAALPPNRPNPFNPATWIAYTVPADLPPTSAVTLAIFDVRGQCVRRFAVEREPGQHEVYWDGTDEHGAVAGTGLYLARFACGDQVLTRKMALVK